METVISVLLKYRELLILAKASLSEDEYSKLILLMCSDLGERSEGLSIDDYDWTKAELLEFNDV